jgi:hypothetical protein
VLKSGRGITSGSEKALRHRVFALNPLSQRFGRSVGEVRFHS